MKDYMIIGEILGVHGVRGELKVKPLTDDPKRFSELARVTVRHKGKTADYAVASVRYHQNQVWLSFEGVTDRTTAETFRGALLSVPREESVPLGPDEFFIADLIGVRVIDARKGDIGTIKDILTGTGSVDTIEIALNAEKKMLYVPFRKVFFKDWDLEAMTVAADIPKDYFLL